MSVRSPCVFCGEKPQAKTQEHIIPKWLLRTANSLKDGFDLQVPRPGFRPESRRMGFASFVLPACNSCNNQYARLEGEVRPIFEAILAGKAVAAIQISKLMDWFDKVRIGIWLWELKAVGNPMGIDPKFSISSRMGSKDRVLKISKFEYPDKAISIAHTGTLAFHYSPSAFGLMVNDVAFLSVSTDNLVGRFVGAAHIAKAEIDQADHRRMKAGVVAGTGVISNPTWQDRWLLSGTCYMQPMFVWADNEMRPQVAECEASRIDAIDSDNGVGAVFRSGPQELPIRMSPDETHNWNNVSVGSYARTQLLFSAEVGRMQRLLCTYFRPDGADDVDDRAYGARFESEEILRDLEASYVRRFGLPVKFCDGVTLPTPLFR